MTLRERWNDRASRAAAACEASGGGTGGLDAVVFGVVWLCAALIERVTR